MNARDRARRYTAAELLAAGVAAGLRLRTPIKWIARQVTVRSAVASCVYTSGMAFLLSMVAADLLGAGAQPTHAQNVFLYYPLCTVVQLLCSPRHKLIATTVQQKSQLAAAKSLLSFSSSFFLTLHNSLSLHQTTTQQQQDVTRAIPLVRVLLRQGARVREARRAWRTRRARAASGSCWRC